MAGDATRFREGLRKFYLKQSMQDWRLYIEAVQFAGAFEVSLNQSTEKATE